MVQTFMAGEGLFSMRVDGEPVPKLRHRTGKNGNTYTPYKTLSYERLIRDMARIYHTGEVYRGPVALILEFEMPIPKSYTRAQHVEILSGSLMHVKRPDLSNLIKSVEDGLNGVVWTDDSQVVRLAAIKRFSDTPGVTIEVLEA